MSNPQAQVVAQLASKGLRPNSQWLSSILGSQKSNPPIQSLVQTIQFRLLTSDITSTLARDACFPTDVASPHVKERKLAGSVLVQLLDIEDISKSRWEQVEAIEAIERGEGKKGREIIRVATTDENDGQGEGAEVQKGGIHKLLLQDASGNRAYAIELNPVEGIGLGMSIGCKFLLRDAIAARGMVLLEPRVVTILGGKIDALHKAWETERKAKLKQGIEEQGL
ncbi:uncharacterized protein KY384_005995 [Bacidia gigantensis]|uniref:uncharacterized protein n=1 Tax=Bacidia gigantensis TaxID=2732470 RepID=UPI001D04C567|nr:uncharacterized protein KY384_005995 [Bacidia gigantensis]KAG8529359.1 hypothetical protein KY384_005995 [Bacidia gigantensis]